MDVLGLFRLENDGKKLPELPVVVFTVVSYAISILLLSTHLIVFSITQRMWTTMGKILASFCVSTMLGFCAFISSTVVKNNHKLYIVGILFTYYCSLTHSSWLLTMSFECWRTFTKKTKSQRVHDNGSSKAFIWYSLFAWIEPAIFLGFALYAEFWNTSTKLPSYLKPNFISVEGSYFLPISAFAFFFVLPLCFNLLLSAIFSIRTNYLHGRINDSVYSPETGELIWEFKLYFRLNLFIILTWMANLLDAFVTRNIICNLFVISLNVIQALYILFVFTFNNKISTLMHYEDEEFGLKMFVRQTDLGGTWGRSVVA